MIGRGGAGEVYLAIDQRIGGPVVMKRTYYAGNDVLGGGFESEARALERVRHQVLPKVTDHFVEQGDQFLVMDFVQGDDLAKRLAASQKPFPLSWVMFWADQILDALIYLHSNEPPIFHRDIKPQNLKLTDQNNIVLLDFGLSPGAVAKLEGQTGVPAQTKPFASLEQIRGGETNARSDVYSLAATLYFLLTGVVPPDAVTRADAVLGGIADPLGSPGTINPEVSSAISEVILKGMSVSHDQRFSDARGMQKALREAYARINEPFGEKTVVMNEPEPQPTGFETLVMPSPTDAQSAPPQPAASSEDMAAKTIPFGMMATEPETPAAATDFDATVQYDGPIEGAVDASRQAPAQSDIRTEVFIKPDIKIEDLPPPPAETSVVETPAASEPYFADATMPIVNLETPSPAPNMATSEARFDSVPSTPPFETTPNASLDSSPAVPDGSTEDINRFSDSVDFSNLSAAGTGLSETVAGPVTAAEPEPVRSAPMAAAPAPKKSRKGFLIGILVGLFLLLVLGAGGAGLAWYAYTTPGGLGGLFGGESPTPTPMTTPEATPSATPSETPTATPEATPSESPTESPTPSESPEATPDSRNTPVTRNTPVPATPRPSTQRTPRPTPSQQPKPSPKPSLRGRDIPQ